MSIRAVTGYVRLVPPPFALDALKDEPQPGPPHERVRAPFDQVTVPYSIEGRPDCGFGKSCELLPKDEIQEEVLVLPRGLVVP